MHITKRPRLPHLRHAWVPCGLPGQPVNLQCVVCCKVKVLHDPVRFERELRAATSRYTSNAEYL